MDLSIYLSIFIPLFGGVSVFSFGYFKTFEFYINYFYIVFSIILVFMLGWNLALTYSSVTKNLIDWWFILIEGFFLCYLFLTYKMGYREFYKVHGHEW